MKAVLLIAGVGKRLDHEGPKVLLEVGGRTLLERHLENLRALGIPVRAVLGWQAERVAPLLDGAEIVINEEYRRGSLISLAKGLEDQDEDLIVMDGDVLYASSILEDVSKLRRGFAIDPRTSPGDEEMMVGVQGEHVRAIRRGNLEGFDLIGEGVGFCKVDRDTLPTLRDAITKADPDGDYENALDTWAHTVGADYVLVGSRPWTEIDFPEDLDRATRDVLPRLAAKD